MGAGFGITVAGELEITAGPADDCEIVFFLGLVGETTGEEDNGECGIGGDGVTTVGEERLIGGVAPKVIGG